MCAASFNKFRTHLHCVKATSLTDAFLGNPTCYLFIMSSDKDRRKLSLAFIYSLNINALVDLRGTGPIIFLSMRFLGGN